MLRTRRERVDLLRKGIDISKIEELYLKNNDFKLVRQPVLFDPSIGMIPTDMYKASQFEGKKAGVSHKNLQFLLIPTMVVFILTVMFPVRVLFALIIGLLFISPVLAAVALIFELASIISKEMEKHSAMQKFAG